MLVSSGIPGNLNQLLVHDFFLLLFFQTFQDPFLFLGFFFLGPNGLSFPMLSVFLLSKSIGMALFYGQVRVRSAYHGWLYVMSEKIDVYIVMFSRCCNHMKQSHISDVRSKGILRDWY